jgi:hypothetical protein
LDVKFILCIIYLNFISFITPKNRSTLREIYKEYLEVHNSHTRMFDWVSHAASFSYQHKLEFTVLGILMMDTLADNLTPIDEAIVS